MAGVEDATVKGWMIGTEGPGQGRASPAAQWRRSVLQRLAAIEVPRPPAGLRRLLEQLPSQPSSLALAAVLNRILLPRLTASQRAELGGRPVQIRVSDLGLHFVVQLASNGFESVAGGRQPAVTVRADLASFLSLARGEDDADRMFFERRLVMEGDTEYGLVIKNTLDALGPLFS